MVGCFCVEDAFCVHCFVFSGKVREGSYYACDTERERESTSGWRRAGAK